MDARIQDQPIQAPKPRQCGIQPDLIRLRLQSIMMADEAVRMVDPRQIAAVQSRLTYAAIGGRETVRDGLAAFIKLTGVDEVMVTGMVHDLDARIRSLEITAEAVSEL